MSATQVQENNNSYSKKDFKTVSEKFEKNNCFVKNIGPGGESRYIEIGDDGEIIVRSRRKLNEAFQHMSYYNEKGKKKNFIKDWYSYNNDLRVYNTVGIYPNNKNCPPGVLNLWRPVGNEVVEKFLEHTNRLYKIKPWYHLTRDNLLFK